MQVEWTIENDVFGYKDILCANADPYFLPQSKDFRPSSPDQNSTYMDHVQDLQGRSKEMAAFFF